MKAPFTPLKICQAVLEEVKSVYSYLTEEDGSRLDLGLDRKVVVKETDSALRGLSLKHTTPEEEREIFCDISDTLRNELICPLSKEERAISKATKDDKAPIKTEVWDKFLYLGLLLEIQTRRWAEAARTIRPLIARHWRRLQLRKWIRFVKEKGARLETVSEHDRDAARECLLRLQATTFWEWKSGSRSMFWNYPKDQQLTMRDGIILWMKGRMDPWLQSQRLPRDPKYIPKVIEKLCVAREKGYIDIGLVHLLISFFEVPKSLTDIRMVYDGTKSGLNEMLWAPWFPLPTIDSLLRSVEPGTWMADVFKLYPPRKCAGVVWSRLDFVHS
jgi:hypothetical protein